VLKKVFVVLLLIVAGVGAFLYFPRGANTSAQNGATLAILNTAIEGARAGAAFAPALDGELYATGDLVRANVDGRAILTFFDGSSLSVDPGSQVKVIALDRVGTDRRDPGHHRAIARAVVAVGAEAEDAGLAL